MINMQELQIKQKDEEFSLEVLKEGHMVTSYQVQKMLNEFFDTRTPGLPYFKPRRINKYEVSDKTEWNTMFSTIKEDLENAYIIYNNQTSYGVVIQNDYDMKMEHINRQLDSLVMKTELLEKYMKDKTAYTPYIINFNDLKDVNMRNLVVHNIPYTTSEIDFDSSNLRNELQSTPNDKIDLSNATIKLEGTHAQIRVDKDIKVITSETVTDTVTITSTSNAKKAPELIMTTIFDESKEVSRIEMRGYSLYNTTISLYVSLDGINYFEKATSEGDPNMIWRFNSEVLKAIKIVILKNTYDYKKEEGNECYYMISNLSVYFDKYKKTSVYTSNVIEMEEIIGDVTISPVHQMPPQTNIAYFVGVENRLNNVEWKSIIPDEKLDLKLLYKEEIILNYQTVGIQTFGARRYDKANKSYYFRIHQLPVNTNLNSIELRAGHSQWLLERLDVTDKYTDGHPTDNKCHTNDYAKSRVTEIAPLDSTIMDIRCEKEWNYFVMSQYAICDNDTIVENRYMEFDVEDEIFDILLLINGKQVFPKNKKYTFKLKKGENLVQIMVLLGKHKYLDSSGDELENVKVIKHNFNLITHCKVLYAGPPMERINYNSLLKNINKFSLKYYAVKEENIKKMNDKTAVDKFVNMLVTKFDPNFILTPNDPMAYDYESSEVNIIDVESITLNKTLLGIGIGSTFQLTADVQPINATNKTVAWHSADPTIATVDSNGLVTAIALGTVNICCVNSTGSIEVKCAVTVGAATSHMESIDIMPLPTISLSEDISVIHFNDRTYEPNYDENNDVIVPIDGEDYPQYTIPDICLNNSEYMRMHVKYKHMLPETKIQITNADGNSNVRLRVMAKLSTGDVTVSPSIKAIKIVGE